MNSQEFTWGALHCGDSAALIKAVPSGSINVTLSDPPYGLGFGPHDVAEHFFGLEEELFRVSAPDAWLVFFWAVKKLGEPLCRLKQFAYRWQIIVEHFSSFTKSVVGERRYLAVLVFSKGNPKVHRRGPDIIQSFEVPQVVGRMGNPLFKPTGAILQLLTRFTNEHSVILDPFAGMGTVPFICELNHIRWLGFEIQPEWFEVACSFIQAGKMEPGRALLRDRIKALQLKLDWEAR